MRLFLIKGGETMKVKVIRSGDKNFEEEKIKMFQPRTLNKEEQLRLVFSHSLTALISEVRSEVESGKDESIIVKYTNIFMYEIKIRTKL